MDSQDHMQEILAMMDQIPVKPQEAPAPVPSIQSINDLMMMQKLDTIIRLLEEILENINKSQKGA